MTETMSLPPDSRLTPIGDAFDGTWGKQVICACTCGSTPRTYRLRKVLDGATLSCGCLRSELSSERARRRSTSHGMSRTAEYQTWINMIRRCTSPGSASWRYYGARGIAVCERWLASFENFYADMGSRPVGRSLDRIDTNGDYEPGNCRWATDHEQRVNKRPRTHCKRGHAFTPENTYVRPNGQRTCRTCQKGGPRPDKGVEEEQA